MTALRAALAAILLVLPTAAFANVDTDAQGWLQFTTSGSIKGGLLGNFDATLRASEEQSRIYDLEINAFIGAHLSKNAILYGGYGYSGTRSKSGAVTREDRARQSIALKLGNTGPLIWTARTITEERHRRGTTGIAVRLRQQVPRGLAHCRRWPDPAVRVT